MMAMGVPWEADVSQVYEDLRPLMLSIAYRMVGSASEAEDIVQEAFLRFHRESGNGTEIRSAKAYLSAITTRLAIDHLRSARVRRERYVGTWLPEPVLTGPGSDVTEHAETADSLSMAFLVLLESLSPIERAVFLLRDVFDYGYDELAGRFFEAVINGDTSGLIELLAADVVVYADGGGKAPAFPHPVHGRDRAMRLLAGPTARGYRQGVVGMRTVAINGQPGAVFLDRDGRPVAVVTVDIADDQVQSVRAIANPDKLRHLGTFPDPSS